MNDKDTQKLKKSIGKEKDNRDNEIQSGLF